VYSKICLGLMPKMTGISAAMLLQGWQPSMAAIGDKDQAGWDEACRWEAAIRDLQNRYLKRLKISAVEAVGWEFGLRRASLYRLIARYRRTRTVEDLRGRASGRPEGTRVLD
jgi:putative transposase